MSVLGMLGEAERRAALLGGKSPAMLRAQMRGTVEARNESESLEAHSRALEKDLDAREIALAVASRVVAFPPERPTESCTG